MTRRQRVLIGVTVLVTLAMVAGCVEWSAYRLHRTGRCVDTNCSRYTR